MFVFQKISTGSYIARDPNEQYRSVVSIDNATVFHSWAEVAQWTQERQKLENYPALPSDWRLVEVREVPRKLEVVRVIG